MSHVSPPSALARRIVITGATNGIGLAAAKALAAGGSALTIVARDRDKAGATSAEIARITPGGEPADVLLADLSSLAEVRRLANEIADRYERVDVLVNNAGAMFSRRQLSVDGIEMTWALNHLGPFLLTTLLLDRLQASSPARIVTTASGAHRHARIPFDDLNAERSYGGLRRYGQSKLANILFTAELARRIAGTGVTATCFHPGLVATGFNHNNGVLMRTGMFFLDFIARRPEKGAETLVWLATAPEAAGLSGGYFIDEEERPPSKAARNADTARRLWQISEEQVARSA